MNATTSTKSDDVSPSINDVTSKLHPQQTWVFHGCLVHATEEQEMCIMEDTIIGVSKGKILFVEPAHKIGLVMKQFNIPTNRLVQMTQSQFLMPGFVDCHAHASQYSFLGTGTDLELIGWLNKYTFPAERRLKKEEDYGLSLYQKCVDRTLRYGTTTISYYATIDRSSTMALVTAIESRGQRAFVGKVNMDMNGPEDYVETTQDSIQETNRFVSDMLQQKNPLIHPCITPRFALACTMNLMKDLALIADKHSLPIQTHLSENTKEVQAVHQTFPHCDSYTDVYDKAGLLGEKTMLAHAIHVSPEELKLIQGRKSGICHCPNSNFSGVMDLRQVLDMDIKVGLGTDFGAGHSPSMLDAIRRGLDAVKVHDFHRQNNKHHIHNNNGATTTTTNNNSNGNSCNNNNMIHENNNNDDNNNNSETYNPRQNKERPHQTKPSAVDWNQTHISYKHLFRLATLGSCQVMGLDDVIGNFMVGKDFDAILVDVSASGTPIDIFPTDSKEDIIQKFIFLGDDRNINQVFVQGRQVIGQDDRTL